MNDPIAGLLAISLFVLIPLALIIVPLISYGKRHGWGRREALGGGLGWSVVHWGGS